MKLALVGDQGAEGLQAVGDVGEALAELVVELEGDDGALHAAGHFAGVVGMLFAIPGYTVLRVIAKEFFNHFKIVRKLTEKM